MGARGITTALLIAITLLGASPANSRSGEPFIVEGSRGETSLTAIYDMSPLGESIVAKSTAIACKLDLEREGVASGTCRVPLTSILVSEEPTRTRHFFDWVTHKKSDPRDCELELTFSGVRVTKTPREGTPLPFEADGKFTVCGRERDDGGTEKIKGIAVILPKGSKGPTVAVQIRAKIEDFDRERYRIGPQYTPGWISRIPKIEKVVAAKGNIEISLVAFPAGR